jgi:hypothetical protein
VVASVLMSVGMMMLPPATVQEADLEGAPELGDHEGGGQHLEADRLGRRRRPGLMMLPPATVALPFKLIFFVLVDGWTLVAGSLVQSYGN